MPAEPHGTAPLRAGGGPLPQLRAAAALRSAPKAELVSFEPSRVRSPGVRSYALERDVELSPYGGWTLKSAPQAAGLEPDECYIVGADQSKEIPDLAIEVVWTSDGVDKLEIYRRLGVGEVWFWRDGRIEIDVLQEEGYEQAAQSRLFPELDREQLCSCLDHPSLTRAVKAFRETLRR